MQLPSPRETNRVDIPCAPAGMTLRRDVPEVQQADEYVSLAMHKFCQAARECWKDWDLLLLVAWRRSADDLGGAARRAAHLLAYGKA